MYAIITPFDPAEQGSFSTPLSQLLGENLLASGDKIYGQYLNGDRNLIV